MYEFDHVCIHICICVYACNDYHWIYLESHEIPPTDATWTSTEPVRLPTTHLTCAKNMFNMLNNSNSDSNSNSNTVIQ